MFDAILAKLRSVSRGETKSNRVSILLPFFIISLGLGVLAWRSYTLSARMEEGASVVATQYSGYAAELTARRMDAAVQAEFARLADEWQQVERRIGAPTFGALRDWLARHDWIVSAIYVPDEDPASSIYVAELSREEARQTRLSREFFTSTGTVRYTYDPRRLLRMPTAARAIRPLPLTHRSGGRTLPLEYQTELSLVQGQAAGVTKREGGFAAVAPLGAPLNGFGIRAFVRTEWVGGKGWQNPRVVSLWVSLAALVLMATGAALALRGIRKESETMKLRGALIANVSHELRTPLSMIRLGAETLRRGRLRDHERHDIEEQILREVLLLSHLVENVLDVARIQNQSTRALAFTPVDPKELIRNLVATYDSWIRSRGFECTLELDEAVGQQMWDRDAVSRALLNLVDNAIKYSGESTSIAIALRRTEEHIAIEVTDHGIGIEARDVNRIFDPYYRARFSDTITRRGAGLGLTLVQQILDSHGGRVEVESRPGEGSTFRLLFPIELSEPAAAPALARTGEAF